MQKEFTIDHETLNLGGILSMPGQAKSWVIFAHGSGSSRLSPRNNWVAGELNLRGHATLLFDLLTPEEDKNYAYRFNISLLADRLELAVGWLLRSPYYQQQPISFFGASTGAAAALVAASRASANWHLSTVISRGGRPDLVVPATLRKVNVPVLLMVGSFDHEVITMNKLAAAHLPNSMITIIPGATHLFEEPGKLEDVVLHSADWLDNHLRPYQEVRA
jgi:pimeloyl-ACP methyl ester carboxylesterase